MPQGLALHEAAEVYEKKRRLLALEEVQDVFRDSYAKHADRLLSETNDLRFWFASGPYRAEDDLPRRFEIGLEQVEKYLRYSEELAPLEVPYLTSDNELAVEFPFEIDLDGVKVVGVIDQVVQHPKYGTHIRDIKSGKDPGDEFQLAVGAVAMNELHDTDIKTGDYWMGRTGKPTKEIYRLDSWTKERITEAFHELDTNIRREVFDPAPDPDKCRFCPVARSCEFAAS